MRKSFQLTTALLALMVTASCAYPIRNQPLNTMDERTGYRWSNLPANTLPDTLVIVSASGGGTRAAALELSVLRGLAKVQLASGGNLADRIDILSSVSGGSVTAAYFALRGSEGFDTLENDFIRQPVIEEIVAAELPFGLLRAAAPSRERIDFLIDYLDRTLFKEKETYAALIKRGKRPLLVLNAADMVEETPFAFTQPNFDLLCSDLSSLKLSTAVAASAAFPVLLSPVTLKNYSICKAQTTWAQTLGKTWPPPPGWVQENQASNWYVAPDRNSRGRVESAYALGDSVHPTKSYIHLLDGGIADNLGVAEPIRILSTNAPSPGYLDDIANGDIKNIIFIMINARSFATSDLDQKPDTPGITDMLMASISSGIDRATLGSAALLRSVLGEKLGNEARRLRTAAAGMRSRPEAARDLDRRAANLEAAAANAKLIPVDFDAIQEPGCRQDFHSIKTSWQNKPAEIDGLLLMGNALMHQAPAFPAALRVVGGTDSRDVPSVAQACAALKK